ncbi:MAG: carboxypeptidase regulatory-like domain-containing protein [Armatimonadetes bacterium]|nr:carboxypeptidase regulatory-like domain-containing protein [Armatimonadota bacterium]
MIRKSGLTILTIAVVLMLCGMVFATPGVWDLAADWSTTTNPNGQWAYGYYDSALASYVPWTVSETPTPDPAGHPGMTANGWHDANGWDELGNTWKNVGSVPFDYWARYYEVGQCLAIGGDPAKYVGAQWTCVDADNYYVYALFTGNTPGYNGPVSVKVLLDGSEIWGVDVAGFIGRLVNNYADASGTAPAQAYRGTQSLTSGQKLAFGVSGDAGSRCRIDLKVMKTSLLGAVSGKVTASATGNPIEGATVVSSDGAFAAVTDASGNYSMSALAGSVTLVASATGFSNKQATLTVTAGNTATQNFALDSAPGVVSGKVTSYTTGAAISGATVTLGSYSTTTNGTGNYSLTVAPNSYTLTVSATGFRSKSYGVTVPVGGAVSKDVRLIAITPGIWDIALDWSSDTNPNAEWTYGMKNADGTFTPYTVGECAEPSPGMSACGWHDASGWDGLGNIWEDTGAIPFEFWGRHFEPGQVLIVGTGNDINIFPGAQWTCPESGDYAIHVKFTGNTVETDYVGAGPSVVRVWRNGTTLFDDYLFGFIGRAANGYADAAGPLTTQVYRSTVSLSAGETITLGESGIWWAALNRAVVDAQIMKVSALGTISGTVTCGGSPVVGATVATADGKFVAQTNGSGAYSIMATPGAVTVQVSCPGYLAAQATVSVTAGNTATQNFSLSSDQGIMGTVTSAVSGAPIPGALVQADGKTVATDVAGKYFIALDAGTYTVVANAGGYASATSSGLVVAANQTTAASFSLAVAAMADLKSDFTTLPACNPSGAWDYGYIDPTSLQWVRYATQEDLSYPGLQQCWHAKPYVVWNTYGNCGKVVGPECVTGYMPTGDGGDSYGAGVYGEPGQALFTVGGSHTPQGCQWTCPAAGNYRVKVRVTGQGTQPAASAADIAVVHNGATLADLFVQGFIGRDIHNFADGYGGSGVDSWEGVVTCAAGDSLQFTGTTSDGYSGHRLAFDIQIMQTATLGTVSGKVSSTIGGAGVAGASLVTPDGTVWAVTDGSGNYSFQISAGSYTLKARKAGFVAASGSVTVSAGGTATRNLSIAPCGTVSGVVTNGTTPIANASVTVVGGTQYAVTATDGTYSMAVPAGTYSIAAAKEGYHGQQTDGVVVTGGGSVSKSFALARWQYHTSLDYSNAGTNPNGTWTYGRIRRATGLYYLYLQSETAYNNGNSWMGWHYDDGTGWDWRGNVAMCGGPSPLDGWSRYAEIGQFVATAAQAGSGTYSDEVGAMWTCPVSGIYAVHSNFTNQGTYPHASGPNFAFVRPSHQPTNEGIVHLGEITDGDWFNGSIRANYVDKVAGKVTSVGWEDTFAMNAGDTLMFQVSVYNGWDVNGHPTGVDVGIDKLLITPTNVASVAALKTVADGTVVTITNPVVATAGTDDFTSGKLYIEDPDRVAGIKVVPSGASTILKGDRLAITGTVGTDANGDKQITAMSIAVSQTPGTAIGALGASNKGVVGSANMPYGLLVTIWGKVIARDAAYIYVDDGSGLLDGSGGNGIRISLSDIAGAGSAPTQSFIQATGILGHAKVGGANVPALYPTSYSSLIGIDTP